MTARWNAWTKRARPMRPSPAMQVMKAIAATDRPGALPDRRRPTPFQRVLRSMPVKTALLAATALGAIALATPAHAQHMGHEQHQPPAQPAPEAEQPKEPAPDHSQMDHQQMDHSQHVPPPSTEAMDHAAMGHSEHDMAMTGAFGSYPMAREASGTAWQPDSSEHGGLHLMSGDWTFMAHGQLDLVYSWQEKPRGDDKVFAAGMLMGMARRPIGDGTL